MTKLVGFVALVLLACAGSFGQVGREADRGASASDVTLAAQALQVRIRRHLLARFDENRDAKLDSTEKRIARAMVLDFMQRERARQNDVPQRADAVRERRERRHDLRDGIRQMVLGLFDRDADGQLNEDELRAAQLGFEHELDLPSEPSEFSIRGDQETVVFRKETDSDPAAHPFRNALSQFDENGDGKLGKQERIQASEEIRQQRDRKLLKGFDEDNDGELNDEERATARQQLERQFQDLSENRQDHVREQSDEVNDSAPGEKDRFEEFLERFDANGDGMLDEQEREQARDAARKDRNRELLEHFDQDGDGELNAEERAAVREKLERKLQDERQRDVAERDESQEARERQNALSVDLHLLTKEIESRSTLSRPDSRGRSIARRRRLDSRSNNPDDQEGSLENRRSGEGSRRFGAGSFPDDDSADPARNPEEEGLEQNARESFRDFQESDSAGQRSKTGTAGSNRRKQSNSNSSDSNSSDESDLSGTFDDVNGQESGERPESKKPDSGIQRVGNPAAAPNF